MDQSEYFLVSLKTPLIFVQLARIACDNACAVLRKSVHGCLSLSKSPITKQFPHRRHQVQNADFGDLFSLAIPAPEPEPEPQTESSKSPVEPTPEQTQAPTSIKRTSPNTSAKRRRLNSEGPSAPAQTHAQPLSNQPSSVNRSSRRALRAPVNPDPYDLENAPSTVHEDGTEDEQIEEGGAIETTPQSRASKQQAPASAKSVAARSAAQILARPQSSPLRLLRGDEVTESPADEPGSGHRRRVRANGAVTSSALLQSALRSVDNDTSQGFLQSSSPLSRKSRKSTAGTVASASSRRTSLRRSTRLSGSPDDEVNELASDPPAIFEEARGAHVSSDGLAQEDISAEVAETVVDESNVIPGDEAEEAQEINDTEAALRIGRKRPRRSEPAVSPELSPDSPDHAVVKRVRKAPPATRNSPAKQRQPKAPRAKSNKPAAPRKKRDEDTAGAVAIEIQRFTQPKPQADDDDSGDEDPLNSTIPYASRSGVNAVDVFAQMCKEIMGKSVDKIKEGIRTAEDAAAKKELRVKLLALQAFREEVRTRLLEHVSQWYLLCEEV